MILKYTAGQLLERLEFEPLRDTGNKKRLIFDEKALLSSEGNRFDIIVSNISLPLMNDFRGVLSRIHNLLEKDGVFLAAVIGEDSLHELRQVLSEYISMPMISMREAGNILHQVGFRVPVTELEKVTVLYKDMFALIRDLKAFKQSGVIGKQALKEAAKMYKEKFSVPEGYVKASFEVIYLHGIK